MTQAQSVLIALVELDICMLLHTQGETAPSGAALQTANADRQPALPLETPTACLV